jgi:thymidylate synthase (FAD)
VKVYLEPKVILLTRPSIDWDGVDALLAEYGMTGLDWKLGPTDGDGDQIPELMGRLCYGSFGDRQGRVGAHDYLDNILSSGHGSVLEHANWGFVVCRASRGHSAQLARHRSGFAHSVESTHFIRYDLETGPGRQEAAACLTGLSGEILDGAEQAFGRAIAAYNEVFEELRRMFPDGFAGKKATCGAVRALLPTGLEAKHGFTANARALRHFCELRGNEDNVLEIRLVAAQVVAIMMVEAPAIFQDFSIQPGNDGYPVVHSEHRKV